jgi:hypothetical protein
MADQIEITGEMKAQIGQQSPPWDYEVTTTSVRAFARGVGYSDPVYFDEAVARTAGYRSLPAPPTYLGTPIFLPGRSSDTFSRPTEGQPAIDHGLAGLLDGGTETETFRQICAGDTLAVVVSITGLEVRDSKALGQMLIMTSETTFTDRTSGELAAVQHGQAIFY